MRHDDRLPRQDRIDKRDDESDDRYTGQKRAHEHRKESDPEPPQVGLNKTHEPSIITHE